MNKRQWKENAHSYMRRYLHQIAHIETLCSGEEEGPIAREAARFDNQGLKGVNLNHILKGMKGIAKSKAALEHWSPAEKQTWTRHQERLAQLIEAKPYKSNPQPAAENLVPAQEHRNMLRPTLTPTPPTRKENHSHILKGMKGIAKSKAALEHWSPAEKQTWTRHQERLAQLIEAKPYKSNPQPASENPAPAQEHGNMLRPTLTPTSPTRNENHSETMPTKPKPPSLAPESANLITAGMPPDSEKAQTGFWRTLYKNLNKVIQGSLK